MMIIDSGLLLSHPVYTKEPSTPAVY